MTTTSDASGFQPNTNTKRKKSFYAEEEDIVVKPSTELIPDEYEHVSNDTVLLHIFATPIEQDLVDGLLQTMQDIDYKIDANTSLHDLNESKSFLKDLEASKILKKETTNKSALILIFIGFFEKNGSLFMMEESDASCSDVYIRDIWNIFSGNNCLELKNKPKIFIFCTSRRPKHSIMSDALRHRTMSFDKVYDFPAESDMLIVYMMANDISQKIKMGFLNQFYNNIKTYSKKYDIIDLVSHMQRSVPLVISTLTRKFYLTPSKEREHYLSIVENTSNLDEGLMKIQDTIQKLHETQKKKKDKKFSFSFKRKTEEKPNILKKESIRTEKPKTSKTVDSPSGRLSAASTLGGIRSRKQSETDYNGRLNPTAIAMKKPLWKN
ncbi:uncharacterized protein BDFB_005547 [Asbolus verrucosus]|uniref:Caspase family p20 domain-containing protein n=1 Tax=Asbolus verrucosus TaxID=1661398 RepID=A0A482VW73_ASBVE|nr:uncharacterized protein BDFB_005547 [Asbolus verrucosus]